MENLISEGFSLMIFGMGFVFVFLTLLVYATTGMSKLVVKYIPEPAPKLKSSASRSTVAAKAAGSNDEVVAVLAAAVHKFRADK